MKLILSLLNVGLEIYWKFLSNLYFYRYFKTNLNFSRHWLIWKSKSISISLLIDYLNPIRLLSCVGQVKLQSSMVRSDVWSRAPVVLVNIPLFIAASKDKRACFMPVVYNRTLKYAIIILLYNCTVISSLETSFLTIFDTFLTFFWQTDQPTDQPMKGDVEAPITELKRVCSKNERLESST